MADLVVTQQTTLPGEEVHVRAAQFFTSSKWRVQSQSPRVSTFVGKPPIPFGMLILTILGFIACAVPGIILYILVIRKMIALQNIVVTTEQKDALTNVLVTYPKHARKMVDRFFTALPKPTPAAS